MKKIVITEFMDQAAVDGLAVDFKVVYDSTLVDDEAILRREIKDADAVIVRNRTQVRGELLKQAENLRVVGRLGVGLDNIDLDDCKLRGIAVFPATGANNAAVAEYVLTAIFILFRQAYQSGDDMINGKWPRTALMGNETAGKVLGLIGFGAIARETCQKAKVLGLKVVAYDPFLPLNDPAWREAQSMDLPELLSYADVISLHVPLTEKTKHLINAEAIAKMKKGVLIVNAARGGVVDETALVQGMKSGQVGGAAIDVFESEPLNADAGQKFRGLSNLILTPHIAGVTIESNQRASALTAENVRKALEDCS